MRRLGVAGPVAWSGLAVVAFSVALLREDVPPPPVERGIRGTIRDDREPCAAWVDVWRVSGPEGREPPEGRGVDDRTPHVRERPLRSVRAGGAGRFAVDGIGKGTYVLLAQTSAGERGEACARIEADGALVDVVVDVAPPPPTLRARIVDARGRGWDGVVEAAAPLVFRPMRVGYDGRIAVVRDGPLPALVRAGVPGDWWVAWRLSEGGRRILEIPDARRPVAGRVVTEDGRPVAGARVRIEGSEGGADEVVAARTDADGRFRATVRLAPRSFRAWAPGRAPASRRPSHGTDVRLVLESLGRVTGRVVDGRGHAVFGAQVVARAPMVVDGLHGSASTGPDGRYVIDGVRPGPVLVHLRGRWASLALLDVRDGGWNPFFVLVRPGATETLDLEATPARLLRGSLRDARGVPVRGAVVRYAPRTLDHGLADGERADSVTDADGEFVIDDAFPSPSFGLCVFPPGGERTWFPDSSLRSDEDGLSVRLPPPRPPAPSPRVPSAPSSALRRAPPSEAVEARRVVVRVTDLAGTSIPEATLGIHRGIEREGVVHSVVDWTLVIGGIAHVEPRGGHGASWLEVYGATGDRPPRLPLPLGPWTGPLDPSATEIVVRLPPERTIDGVVRDSRGTPIGGVLVRAIPRDGRGEQARTPLGGGTCCRESGQWREEPLGLAHGIARSDSSGRFRVGGLGDAAYDLWTKGPPDAVPLAAVRARGGDSGVVLAAPGRTTDRRSGRSR